VDEEEEEYRCFIMELTLKKKHENRIEFTAKGISPTFANAVRRYVMNRVPVLSIDTVTFYDNTTSLWDEYIAHRLGLMPIVTPEKTPASAEVMFSLDETGPKVVYGKDLKCSDKAIKIAQDDIVVVTLGQNQHVRLEAKAVLGTGSKHGKFQAGLVSYGIEGGDFNFMVESFYQMAPARVIGRACDEIGVDIDTILGALSGKKAKKPAAKKTAAKKAPAKKAAAKKTTTKKTAKKK
jgi:DNA-directed RNA polymerase subunit D